MMRTQETAHAEIQTESLAPSGGATQWHAITRVGFRFFFVYFLLYSFPRPLTYIPGSDRIFARYTQAWHATEVWVGEHVLHLGAPMTRFTNGSGDTTSDYVRVMCLLVLAALTAEVWSLLDRRRADYRKLHSWLRLYVRIVLGAILLSYGAAKVIKTQFPQLFLSTLVEPYGESSPMGLLWSFMEYSAPYTIFAGVVEMLGGLLLFAPRLATLGGLLVAASMTNVFMINMSYDVPVKLYSFHLLAMAVFLVAPDLQRLANVFVFNRRVEGAVNPPVFRRLWLNRGLLGLQLVLGPVFASISLYGSYQNAKMYGFLAPKPPLYGIWSVEEFTLDGEMRPPLVTDELRWQRVIFDSLPSVVALQQMSGERQRYLLNLDLSKKKFTLSERTDPKRTSEFTIERPQADLLLLDGKMDGRQIHAKLHLQPDGKYLLLNRGFHWINEYPFNR